MRRLIATLLVASCTVVAAATAADSPADGTWKFSMSSPMGAVDATVRLKGEGETLTGAFVMGTDRVWDIEQGSIKGTTISFVVNRDRPMGGTMPYAMQGTISGDTITGTASAMGQSLDWTMTRAK